MVLGPAAMSLGASFNTDTSRCADIKQVEAKDAASLLEVCI